MLALLALIACEEAPQPAPLALSYIEVPCDYSKNHDPTEPEYTLPRSAVIVGASECVLDEGWEICTSTYWSSFGYLDDEMGVIVTCLRDDAMGVISYLE